MRLAAVASAALLAFSLTARPAAAQEVLDTPAGAPADAIPTPENFSLNTAHRPGWRPAAISLGATALGVGLSIGLLRSRSTTANVWGGMLLPVAVIAAPSAGWLDIDDSSGASHYGFAVARGGVLLGGGLLAGTVALSAVCWSGIQNQCPSQRSADARVQGAVVIAGAAALATGALAVVDIAKQALFTNPPPVELSPTLTTDANGKKSPGLAIGGAF